MSARSQNPFERALPLRDLSLVSRGGPQFSEHAQKAVLGAALMENSLMRGPLAALSLDDMMGSRDRTIYALMLELSAEGENFDLSSIIQILEDRGQLERAGGVAYIASLIDGVVPEPGLMKRHVESIQKKARLRRVQAVCERLLHEVGGADPNHLLLELLNTLNGLQAGRDLNGDLLACGPSGVEARPEILKLSQVEAREVDWLWRPYLAKHTLAMLSGYPGAGKTYVAMAIGAAVTLGQEPSTKNPTCPADVLCLSVENSPEHVLRPRFDKLGGDANRFHILQGSVIGEGKHAQRGSVKLSDVSLLHDALTQTNARFVFVDPIQSYLGADVDAHRSNETRPVLDGLARLAEEHKCCILLLRHLGKAQTARAIHRGLGSIDLTGAVRTELIAGSAPNDANQRALVQVKSNLGQFGASIGYAIEADGTFRWTGESQLTASQILAAELNSEQAGPMTEAKEFLSSALSQGNRPANDVKAEALQAGISGRTLIRAKAALRVTSHKRGMDGIWDWSLPEGGQK